jgi:hypothetical protein
MGHDKPTFHVEHLHEKRVVLGCASAPSPPRPRPPPQV